MSNYNGWTNWETWNLHLWLSNNEYTQRDCEAYCSERSIEDAAVGLRLMVQGDLEAKGIPSGWFGADEPVLVDMLSGWFGDVLGSALERVNWEELAAAFMTEQA